MTTNNKYQNYQNYQIHDKASNTAIIELLGKKDKIYKKLYFGILNVDDDTNFIYAFDKLNFTHYEEINKEKKNDTQYINKIKHKYNFKSIIENGCERFENGFECVCGQKHLTHLNVFKHKTQTYSYIIGSTCIKKIIQIINLIEKRKTLYELELLKSKLTDRIEIMKNKELIKKELEKITEIKGRFEVMKKIIKDTKKNTCINCPDKLPNKSKFHLKNLICKECHTYENSIINIKCKHCNYKNITINLEKETDFNLKLYEKTDKKCKQCRIICENKKNGIYNLICEICKEEYQNKNPFQTTKCYPCYSEHIHNTDKIYLNIPFDRKDEGKEFGTKWDKNEKSWYIFDDNEHKDKLLEMFSKKNINN
jgi:hypothetical protein